MINDFNNIEIPKGCLIAKQAPSFAVNSKNQFSLRPEILDQKSEYVNCIDQEWISNIISVMVAFNLEELDDPTIEFGYGTLNEFKSAIVSELSEILPCKYCPLINTQCLPELRFDEEAQKIRVIPRPIDYISPEGLVNYFEPMDDPIQKADYNDLPLAS
jgi:hypothetical protein